MKAQFQDETRPRHASAGYMYIINYRSVCSAAANSTSARQKRITSPVLTWTSCICPRIGTLNATFEIENVNLNVEFFFACLDFSPFWESFWLIKILLNKIDQKNRVCYFEFFCVNGFEVHVTFEVFTPNVAV